MSRQYEKDLKSVFFQSFLFLKLSFKSLVFQDTYFINLDDTNPFVLDFFMKIKIDKKGEASLSKGNHKGTV